MSTFKPVLYIVKKKKKLKPVFLENQLSKRGEKHSTHGRYTEVDYVKNDTINYYESTKIMQETT
jgi:hypothetical protein